MNRLAKISFIFLTVILSSVSGAEAQGITRSRGFGIRAGFWKTAKSNALINVNGTSVEVSGVGGWLYYSSRVGPEWFYELHFGAFASAIINEFQSDSLTFQDEDVTVIMPFLFGLRHDIFSANNFGGLQPYISFGAGPYWITNVDVPVAGGRVETVDSGLQGGAYAGGGVNLALTSWFAFNLDLKYHFVDFKFGKDFSGPEFGFGVNLMWGQQREIMRVLGVRTVVTDIYPAYYQFYNHYPIAMVTVKNMTKSTIEVNVRSNVRYFSERAHETGFVKIAGKETKDIPINAILGSRIRDVKQREVAILDLQVEGRAGKRVTKKLSSSLMVHNPNSWNGEMDKLAFFVTADDEHILELSREIVGDMEAPYSSPTRNFEIGRHLFEKMVATGIRYQSDPNIPFYQDDRVQFATETLDLQTGDCDDLVVLYASLLESVGINTAFVEVRDPEKSLAHLYLMFDTALPPDQGHGISSNEKRYVVRANSIGKETVWIPVETTQLSSGFDTAWEMGALAFLQEGKLRGGLQAGWVKVFDVD